MPGPQLSPQARPVLRGLCRWCCAIMVPTFLTAAAIASNHKETVGFYDLAERIGEENLPTGKSLQVAIVEGLQNGNYRPDENHSEFEGKDFEWMSGGSKDPSSHATSVGRRFFGLDSGLVPLIPLIYSYEASGFLQNDWLRANFSPTIPPHPTPGDLRVANHSWVGTVDGFNNAVLRRVDYVMDTDDVLMVAGVHNSSSSFPLLSNMFNGISVGRDSGNHGSGPTLDEVDVPGRMKPEIVAPGNTTSSATPVVASAAAMMIDIARTHPDLISNPNADRAIVAKAVLLAGARHEEGWTNNPIDEGPLRGVTDQPIDEVFGVGTVNVDRSHMILTGGEHAGSAAVPDSAVPHAGWNRISVPAGASRYWRFAMTEEADEVSIIATWNRQVSSSNMNSWSIAHFELELWQLDDRGNPASLIGDAGLDVFSAGNVVSESPVDNIQHLYINDLAEGDYLLELRRVDSLTSSWPATVAWLFPEMDIDTTPGDLNGDGSVGVADLLILIGAWGACADCDDCPADLNGDCNVGITDLLILINNWG